MPDDKICCFCLSFAPIRPALSIRCSPRSNAHGCRIRHDSFQMRSGKHSDQVHERAFFPPCTGAGSFESRCRIELSNRVVESRCRIELSNRVVESHWRIALSNRVVESRCRIAIRQRISFRFWDVGNPCTLNFCHGLYVELCRLRLGVLWYEGLFLLPPCAWDDKQSLLVK